MIPLYFGVGDEKNQGLCTGTENYWCVNKTVSPRDIKATLDFITWCVTSEEGTKALAQKMGFSIPFKKAVYSENIFIQQNAIYTAMGKTPVSWDFTTIPSDEWKTQLGKALTNYAANQTDFNWDKVVKAFVDNWSKEYNNK
jgi:raffinose/stachyose/melibiose transport system substrate-binding protein